MTSNGVKHSWQKVAAAKKAEQDSRIPSEWKLSEEVLAAAEDARDLRSLSAAGGIMTDRELEITGGKFDAIELSAEIVKGTYTAVEVTTAYCKRAAIGQQLLCCLTEIRFRDAIAEAEKLDAEFKKTGKPRGRLHGVPMTCKVSDSDND